MRLIDADEMLKRLEEWNTKDKMDRALYNFTWMRIMEQPTAFDVEEVLAHLQSEHDKWTKGVEQVQAMGLDDLRRNLSGRAFGISDAIKIIEIEKMKQQIKYWPLERDAVIKTRCNFKV